MHSFSLTLIFFIYGLSFFSMGVVIMLEVGRCSNLRLRQGLWYLAAFGVLHGIHEWIQMFLELGITPPFLQDTNLRESVHMGILAFSFLALVTFGMVLIAPDDKARRLGLMLPLSMAMIWAMGLLVLRNIYVPSELWLVIEAWTRYILAIPSALLACTGLIFQQREFRRAGLSQFGRDTLWAAVAFAWYGLIGQMFVSQSALPPSTVLNAELFLSVFGFPVQVVRASAAIFASVFVVRFLRSFEVETKHKIEELQQARLEEAERREQVYGELLRRVVAAQEAERQRIARELHDETGQALTAIGLGLRGISTSLNQDPTRAASNLRQLETLSAHSLVELQRLISDLRPSHLDDLGLPAALRWYANEIQNRANLKVLLEFDGEASDLSTEMKTALFRVAQEALTNVLKHSEADCAIVRLKVRPDAVALEVEDDGCGFDPLIMRSGSRPSWGLLGMEERASLLGGNLKLFSKVGSGTRVQIVIPFHQPFEVKNGNLPGIGG